MTLTGNDKLKLIAYIVKSKVLKSTGKYVHNLETLVVY